MPLHTPSIPSKTRFFAALVCLLSLGACGVDDIPPELRPLVDTKLPLAISLAKGAAEQCQALRSSGEAPKSSPALGTALATDLEVVEILARCDWSGDEAPEEHAATPAVSFPALRQAPPRSPAPQQRVVYDTFVKRGDQEYERALVPSRFGDVPSSIDIVVTQSIPGGGSLELTVAAVRR